MRYDILNYKERLAHINDLLENELDVNLEQAANYLLNSKDIEQKKDLKYRIFSNRELFRKRIKEYNQGLMQVEGELDILVENKNKTIEKKQKIKNSDMKKPVIKDYQAFINVNTENKWKLDYLSRRKVENMCREIKRDQILSKNQLEGTIYFKHVGEGTSENNLDWIDFDNKDHILALLKFRSNKLDTWLGCITNVINDLIGKVKFTERQRLILQLWREEDRTQDEIAEELEITQPAVSKQLDKISELIVNAYIKSFEDYKYTYLVKGKYKTCSKCGEVKLVGEFGLDKRNRDGFKSICKSCDNLHKK